MIFFVSSKYRQPPETVPHTVTALPLSHCGICASTFLAEKAENVEALYRKIVGAQYDKIGIVSEGAPKTNSIPSDAGPNNEQALLSDKEYVELAERLRERMECFSFPGLRQSSYTKLKAESDEFPDLMTPIDELVQSLQKNGFQIIEEANKNVFILPYDLMPTPDNVRDFSIFPRDLEVTIDMDLDLKRFILARR